MNKIEKLIKQYCSKGVEFKELGEIVKISNGKDHKHLAEGSFPVYGSGGIMRYANQFMYNEASTPKILGMKFMMLQQTDYQLE